MPIARKIISDCTPVEQSPQDIVTALRFTKHLTEEFPEEQQEKEERLHDIAALVQYVETDTVDVTDPWFEEAFRTAESYKTMYHTSSHYDLALNYLKRLYTIREQTQPLRITRNNLHDNDTSGNFAIVLRELIEEL